MTGSTPRAPRIRPNLYVASDGQKKSFITRDGRKVCYVTRGNPNGRKKVFLLHGMPGSAIGPLPPASEMFQDDYFLVAIERPGFGDSDRLMGHSVADLAKDVEDLANHLGIDRFGVMGRSGGGPYAEACAALLGSRVRWLLTMVATPPPEAWAASRRKTSKSNISVAQMSDQELRAWVDARRNAILDEYHAHLDFIDKEMSNEDHEFLQDHNGIWRDAIAYSHWDAVKNSSDGWYDGVQAIFRARNGWGFSPSALPRIPTVHLYGANDMFCNDANNSVPVWRARTQRLPIVLLERISSYLPASDYLPAALWGAAVKRGSGVKQDANGNHVPARAALKKIARGCVVIDNKLAHMGSMAVVAYPYIATMEALADLHESRNPHEAQEWLRRTAEIVRGEWQRKSPGSKGATWYDSVSDFVRTQEGGNKDVGLLGGDVLTLS